MAEDPFDRALRRPAVYAHQLERLHARHLGSPSMFSLRQDGVPLASMIQRRRTVSRRLARTVASGAYRPAPAEKRTIQAGRKQREIYLYPLVDRIVLGAIADELDRRGAALRSAQLYSYQRGRSNWSAVADLARYIRRQRSAHADPRDRWLHVLRRDVTSYTDSIPTGPDAPIWAMVQSVAGPVDEATWALIELAVRPEVAHRGRVSRPDRGLPLGQPISGVLANLYLHDLDRRLEQVDGAFYARYGDDMVFAHPEAAVVREAAATIDEHVERLGLSTQSDKDENFVLTGAGRPAAAWPDARPATSVGFLGAEVTAHGTIGLKTDKLRPFVRDLAARAKRANRAMSDRDEDARGRAVCAAVNESLDLRSTTSHQSTATNLIRRVVTDRGQLRDLDQRIAGAVRVALTGSDDVRVMRRLPNRKLRHDWGLISLEHARNRHGRRVPGR